MDRSHPDLPGFDRAACAATVTRALQLPGGGELVVGSLGGLPGAVVTRRRTSRFGGGTGSPSVLLGQWRYQCGSDGRIEVAHVVGGIVLAEHTASPKDAGPHIAMAVGQLLADHGERILPDVLGMVEGLSVAAD